MLLSGETLIWEGGAQKLYIRIVPISELYTPLLETQV